MPAPTGRAPISKCCGATCRSGSGHPAPTRCGARRRLMISMISWPGSKPTTRRCTSAARGGAPPPAGGGGCRCATGDGRVHHFIEALCRTTVLGMNETGAGAEGPAIAALLEELDLSGRIVTVDAAGATPAVAPAITGSGADFLLAVKDNQPGLRGALEAAFQAHAGRTWTSPDRGHGRHEVRRARTITARKTVGAVAAAGAIPGIRTLCRIERTRITKDGIATTVHYHVSTQVLTPRRYARHVRAHWRVEAMHHVVDGALDEDACRIAKAAGVMAALRRLAFTVIAELRGAVSFRRFAEFVRANPTPLLELCAVPR